MSILMETIDKYAASECKKDTLNNAEVKTLVDVQLPEPNKVLYTHTKECLSHQG